MTSTSPSVDERALVRALAEQRARLVDAGRVEEHDLGRSAVVRTPRTCVRVVCGRSETIETLRPTMLVHERRLPDVGPADDRDESRTERSLASLGVGRRSRAADRLGHASSAREPRLMSTDTMRRPCTRSAQNSRPSTRDALALDRARARAC